MLRNLPAPFRGLYRRYANVRAVIEGRIHVEAQQAAIALDKLAAPDASTGQLIEVLADPASASAGKLKDAYASAGDADGKKLLTFPDITAQIDADISFVGGTVTPERFNAMAYGLRLSKLALLDQAGMRRLVWRLGGDPERIGAGRPGR